MGFELNKLMRQYGLATPTMLSYEGERGPDVEVINEETGEVTTTPGEITFDPAKQRAFDQYQAQYQSRLRNAPMYAGSQFQTQTTPQPMSYMQMYQQYLGRDPTDQERTEAIGLDAKITQDNPLSLAQRQQFLRRFEDEFKNLGIRNTGNQAVMDTIGNYYGNILRNPDYSPTPIDRSLPFAERFPNRPNPNPPTEGPLISTDEGYLNAVDDQGNVSQTFLDFSAQQQQNLANIANPLPDDSISTLEEARTIDPFAESSIRGVPAYGAYLAKNQDVFNNILARPEYQAVLSASGPGSQAVDDFVAQAAKDHFVNFGFQEGRQFYKTGGPVKGYQLGGQEGQPIYSDDELMTTGLNVMIEEQTGLTEGDGPNVNQPPSTSNIDAMEAALQSMSNFQNPYDPVLKQLSGQVAGAQTIYDQQLAELLANTRKGPDKAELYFNLAAALSAPTKTGTFGESLGLAAKEFGKFSSESRKMEQSADALKLKQAESKLKSLQSRYTKIQDKQSEEAIRNQEQQFEMIKFLKEFGLEGEKLALTAEGIALKKQIADYEQKFKPLNEFGKQAVEEGFVRGTPGYQARSTELYLESLKKNRKMPQFSSKILSEKVGAKQTAMLSLAQLRRALELNENAYANNFTDNAFYLWKKATGSKNKKFQDTELLENILSSEALAKLKATFGGQISDGERKALEKLSGATAATKDVRREIIKEAMAVLERISHNAGKDIEWFGDPDRYNAPLQGYDAYINRTHKFANPRTTQGGSE